MYASFFGLDENPFNLTPDPRYLYLSRCHKEALGHLHYGINERKGFIAITGGIGTGKTTLCRVLLNSFNDDIKSALIFNSFLSDMELLKSVNQEFGIQSDSSSESKKELIDNLNTFLMENYESGGNAVILIDEAQNLSRDVLEQIRMLSNLETENEKLIQIILVGQPELKELLASPSLRQLQERITVRYDLNPLAYIDVRRYMEHRLSVAGSHGDLRFTERAIKNIYRYSKGNPRLINALCDRTLLGAFAMETSKISGNLVCTAIKELQGNYGRGDAGEKYSRRWITLLGTLTILAILIAYLNGLVPGNKVTGLSAIISGEGTQDEAEAIPRKYPMIKENITTLFLNEKDSFAFLFDLFRKNIASANSDRAESGLTLMEYELLPEYYVTLKMPFRVLMKDIPELNSQRSYLLIDQATEDKVIVIDNNGQRQSVSREYILEYWGGQISFFYQTDTLPKVLKKSMESPEVKRVQEALGKMGYLIEPKGVYDETTVDGVRKFQKDFGLKPDGIAGPRTLALLYNMAG